MFKFYNFMLLWLGLLPSSYGFAHDWDFKTYITDKVNCREIFEPIRYIQIASNPLEGFGGDWGKVTQLAPQNFAVEIYDFTGHGRIAHPHVLRFKRFLAQLSPEISIGFLEHYIQKLNLGIASFGSSGLFAASFHGIIDNKNNTLEFVSTGGISPILINKAKSRAQVLDESNLALGIIDDPGYKSQTINFTAEDSLLVMTDGVYENVSFKTDGKTMLTPSDFVSYLNRPGEIKKLSNQPDLFFKDYQQKVESFYDDQYILIVTSK